MRRKLTNARNDFTTVPLLLLPSAAAIVAAAIYVSGVVTDTDWLNDLVAIGIYAGESVAIYIDQPDQCLTCLLPTRSLPRNPGTNR